MFSVLASYIIFWGILCAAVGVEVTADVHGVLGCAAGDRRLELTDELIPFGVWLRVVRCIEVNQEHAASSFGGQSYG
jgi:hypothetical protein